MRLVRMVIEFLQKFLLLSKPEKLIITHMRADIGRKREFNRNDGFVRTPVDKMKDSQAFVYEPSLDQRLGRLRLTGPYFRIWFTVKPNGDVYFMDFVKLD
jgi:hypothetical protein